MVWGNGGGGSSCDDKSDNSADSDGGGSSGGENINIGGSAWDSVCNRKYSLTVLL